MKRLVIFLFLLLLPFAAGASRLVGVHVIDKDYLMVHFRDGEVRYRNDGVPGTHPGQTPYNGVETWSKGNGGEVPILLRRCYPAWESWPRQESFFNQRYLWANSEFTPRETMRGKLALTAYLYSLSL